MTFHYQKSKRPFGFFVDRFRAGMLVALAPPLAPAAEFHRAHPLYPNNWYGKRAGIGGTPARSLSKRTWI